MGKLRDISCMISYSTSPFCLNKIIRQAVVAHAFNLSTWEAEKGGSLLVWGQPGQKELVQGQTPKPQRNPVLKIQLTNQPTNQLTNQTNK